MKSIPITGAISSS